MIRQIMLTWNKITQPCLTLIYFLLVNIVSFYYMNRRNIDELNKSIFFKQSVRSAVNPAVPTRLNYNYEIRLIHLELNFDFGNAHCLCFK